MRSGRTSSREMSRTRHARLGAQTQHSDPPYRPCALSEQLKFRSLPLVAPRTEQVIRRHRTIEISGKIERARVKSSKRFRAFEQRNVPSDSRLTAHASGRGNLDFASRGVRVAATTDNRERRQ